MKKYFCKTNVITKYNALEFQFLGRIWREWVSPTLPLQRTGIESDILPNINYNCAQSSHGHDMKESMTGLVKHDISMESIILMLVNNSTKQKSREQHVFSLFFGLKKESWLRKNRGRIGYYTFVPKEACLWITSHGHSRVQTPLHKSFHL